MAERPKGEIEIMKDSKQLLNRANKIIADFTGKKSALLADIEKAETRAAAADQRAAEAVTSDNVSEFSAAKRLAEAARDLVEFKKAQLSALTTEAERIEDFRKFADEAAALRDEIHEETIKELLKIQDKLKALLDYCDQEEKAATEMISNLGEILGIDKDEIGHYTCYIPMNYRILAKNYYQNIDQVNKALDEKNPAYAGSI